MGSRCQELHKQDGAGADNEQVMGPDAYGGGDVAETIELGREK